MEPEWKSELRNFVPVRLSQWIGAALTFAVLAGVSGVVIAASGFMNISAIPPHPVIWARLLHFASARSFSFHANPPAPSEPLDSRAMIALGATQYDQVCAHCHGAPGFGQNPVALSMRPEPPNIILASKIYSEKQLYYVVQNGVRYTGMPAWPVTNRPDEVWAMVAFIKAMPGMDRRTYLQLVSGHAEPPSARPAPGAAALSPFVASTRPRPYLPGDPQTAYPSPEAVVYPRIGFMNPGGSSDILSRCTTCHGADESGRPEEAFPNLTLQSPQYLYDSLTSFAHGQRQSGIMWAIAANLSDEEMRNIAAQLGGRPPVATPAAAAGVAGADPARTARLDRGRAIALEGIRLDGSIGPESGSQVPSFKVVRCSSCHMPAAPVTGLDRTVPRLDGQHAAYLRLQMHAFRGGGRGDTGPFNPMVADSHNLSDPDIAAVSEYYASLPPMKKD
jgi:cytochrome c553